MEQLEIQAKLEELYMNVEEYDVIQEKILDICIKLNKLDSEEELYHSLQMPDLLEMQIESVKVEKSSLLKIKSNLEKRISKTDLDDILSQIDFYEQSLLSNNII